MFVASNKMIQVRWTIQTWVCLFLTASLFTLPLSSTAKSIVVAMTLSLIVLTPDYRRNIIELIAKPWCQAAVILFAIALVACLWSPATGREKFMGIEKYAKLLYLPILVAGFQEARARQWALYGFLFAMLVTVLISLLIYSGLYSHGGTEANSVFRNHIMTGYMMAFAAYLSSFLAMQQHGKMRILHGVFALIFTYFVLFINNGRTGYVIFVLLMLLFLFQTFAWRKALIGMLAGGALILAAFCISPVMQDAIKRAVDDCQQYSHVDKNTSIGYRLQFHDYAYELFKRHPIIGNGTTSFKHLFHTEDPIPARKTNLLEPHSQYWLVASEFGTIGCLALAFFFGSLLIASWRLETLRPLALAILLPFLLGSLSDSLLFYSGTGYFFILFMALCLGEQQKVNSHA